MRDLDKKTKKIENEGRFGGQHFAPFCQHFSQIFAKNFAF